MPGALDGFVVLSFESRRAEEMAELIRRHGGTPVVAPSMREVPLEENPVLTDFLQRLEGSQLDVVIFLTGVGLRTLVAALRDRCDPERFADLLRRTTIVARGPKPVAALRELGLVPHIAAPEPNTWRELIGALDDAGPIEGRHIAVQEYGMANDELIAALRSRGARVLRVPVYRWALPLDTGPLYDGVRRLADRKCHAALFTSATQVDHVAQVARELGLEEALVGAAQSVLIASIGPICNDALRRHGLPVDIEPEHPKMGQLVAAVAREGRRLWAAKCARIPH
jgi:uroporphyrinogen-III synthase